MQDSIDNNIRVDAAKLAALARIELEEDECRAISQDLSSRLRFIDSIANIDTTDVPPTEHVLPPDGFMRADIPCEGMGRDAALSNAPSSADGLVVVPKTVGEGAGA